MAEENDLLQKIEDEDVDAVTQYLDAGGDPNYIGSIAYPTDDDPEKSFSLLNWAVMQRPTAKIQTIIDALLAKGARPDLPTSTTPLRTAASLVKLGLLMQFIDKIPAADVANALNENDTFPEPLLILVAKQANYGQANSVMNYLLEKGADVNIQSATGKTALMEAVRTSSGFDGHAVVRTLLGKGADITIEDSTGKTAMHYAAQKGIVQIAQLLLEGREDENGIVNTPDQDGVTPLMMAANESDPNMLGFLLEHGAQVDAIDDDGNTALILASKRGYTGNVNALIDGGADVNLAVTEEQWTALMWATIHGNLQVVPLLLAAGANVNAVTTDGETSLMLAAAEDDINMVRLLLERGADKTLRDRDGQTAYDKAHDNEVRELLRVEDEPEGPIDLWEGTTREDIQIFNSLFDDLPNWSCCPVCLGYVQRSEACRYMHHNCAATPGVVANWRLYNLYRTPEGFIYWCTTCGRICTGHRHHMLSPHQSREKAPLARAGDPFGEDAACIADGGGGTPEKIKRFDRMIAYTKELQDYKLGSISVTDAHAEIIEETWNAPFIRNQRVERILAEKKFTIPPEAFPAAVAPAAAEPEGPAPDIAKPADEIANVPEEVPQGEDVLDVMEEVRPAIRFVHKKQDGSVYRHTDGELVGKNGLTEWVRQMNTRFGTAEFGYCFLHPECDAKLWPQDIQPYITDPAIFDEYKRRFNEKFRRIGQVGGANYYPSGNIMVYIGDSVQCQLPKKEATRSGKGRTYRKIPNKTRRRTYRKN